MSTNISLSRMELLKLLKGGTSKTIMELVKTVHLFLVTTTVTSTHKLTHKAPFFPKQEDERVTTN